MTTLFRLGFSSAAVIWVLNGSTLAGRACGSTGIKLAHSRAPCFHPLNSLGRKWFFFREEGLNDVMIVMGRRTSFMNALLTRG